MTEHETRVEAYADRVFQAGLGMADVLTMYIGDRLGLYAALATSEPLTAAELAITTGIHERYAREWLEQQAVTAMIDVRNPEADPSSRRYGLSPEAAEVLTHTDGLWAMAWLGRLFVGAAQALPKILDAFRTGGGVGWAEYGADVIEGQGDQNRPIFEHLLAQEWLPSIPGLHERLLAGGSVTDMCCGVGWSSIAIARAYPRVTVEGFDVDPSSIAMAQANAREAGVADRVRFEARDASRGPVPGRRSDLVCVFESIHDLADPVAVLRAMRETATPDGTVLVMDERVADRFTAPGDDVERLMFGYSVLICLPASMTEHPSAATGTVMRADTFRAYALEAGFSDVEILPIEHPFFRFYRPIP